MTIQTDTKIFYRELTAREDLLAYFRLRYRESQLGSYHIPTNRDELNIESFDFFSHFVGAFLRDDGEELIGGIRMVKENEEGGAARVIREICDQSQDLKEMRKELRLHPFQLMEALDLSWLIEDCKKKGRKLVEFSRTVVGPEHRRTGIGSKLVKAILELGADIGADVGFGGCPQKLEHFYELAGCEVVSYFYHPLYDFRVALLKIDLESLRGNKAQPNRYALLPN